MQTKLRRLRVLGRFVAVGFAIFFSVGIIGHLTGSGVDPQSEFGQLVRWGAGGEPQEVMLGSVYLAIAACLWAAAGRPLQHWLFLDFALVANVAHSLAMVVLSLAWPRSMSHLWGDSLFTIVPTVLLAYAWLPVRAQVLAVARPPATDDEHLDALR